MYVVASFHWAKLTFVANLHYGDIIALFDGVVNLTI
jgi:hypothetical protein